MVKQKLKMILHYPDYEDDKYGILDTESRICRVIKLDTPIHTFLGNGFFIDLSHIRPYKTSFGLKRKVHVDVNSVRSMKYGDGITVENENFKIVGHSLKPDTSVEYNKNLDDTINNSLQGLYLRQVKQKWDLTMVLAFMGSGAILWHLISSLLNSRGVNV